MLIFFVFFAVFVFLSTLPARGATFCPSRLLWEHWISIHAPREGSDVPQLTAPSGGWKISIHAPREGSDGLERRNHRRLHGFLSTLPARGATLPP